MSSLATAQTYWLQALAEPVGLGLIVSAPAQAKTQLYAARKSLVEKLPELANFSIRTSPDNPAFELWLLRNAPPVAGPSSPSPPEENLDLSILEEPAK